MDFSLLRVKLLDIKVQFAAGHQGLPEHPGSSVSSFYRGRSGRYDAQLTNMAICKMQFSFEGVKSIFLLLKTSLIMITFPESFQFFFFFFTISTFFSSGQVPSRPNCAHVRAVSRV